MPKAPENLREFAGLVQVVEILRGPDGCPWDKEQTHSTLTRYAIEESFELAEAIDSGDAREICDELGDLLLQVILHAEIARQAGRFDIFDVMENLNRKMVRRHPHVFADIEAKTSAQVLQNWSQIKAQERGQSPDRVSSFDIPAGLPSLLRSQKIGEKTKKVSFDWENAEQCWTKVREELAELELEIHKGNNAERMESELGDLLFSLAQFARHKNLDAEQTLRKTNRRFEHRFQKMQQLVQASGKVWDQLTPEDKEKFWKQAK
ncbi:MAG: nucleoside triphosphate pyrophosphohydrolase [Bdellovibrionales bacterium]